MLDTLEVTGMQATIAASFPHTLVIERASEGAADDRGVPAQSWATLATVSGRIEPKTVREAMQLSQAGPVVSTHTAYLLPTDIAEGDRIASGGSTYQIDGIRDPDGLGIITVVDAHLVEYA
jgi:head-tail adaptor